MELLLWIFHVFFCLVFAIPLCASVYMCLVVTCWERADLLALVCGVQMWVCHLPIGILGQVWYFIVSIPDLCTLFYFLCAKQTRHILLKNNLRPGLIITFIFAFSVYSFQLFRSDCSWFIQFSVMESFWSDLKKYKNEPCCEKSCLRIQRPGKLQSSLLSYRD